MVARHGEAKMEDPNVKIVLVTAREQFHAVLRPVLAANGESVLTQVGIDVVNGSSS